MIKKLISFFQKDAVLTVSFFLAVLSCFFCPPGPQYLGYLDFHTLILLFCLMLIVAGLRECGVFGCSASDFPVLFLQHADYQ